MNCTVLQRRLLSAERPDQPADDARAHLSQCPACRAWHRRLMQAERQIPQLPVPPTAARDELLRRILGPSADAPPPGWRSTLAPGPKERGQRKLSVAFALAASLLIFALAWWSWPNSPDVPRPDPARAEQARLDERLRLALSVPTSRARVLGLAELAEKVHGEAGEMADHAERLERWSKFYARVVGEHLVAEARRLPADERPQVLTDVARRLSKLESEAARRATALKGTSPRSAASFDRIALVSRQGEQDLRRLMVTG